MLMHGGKLWKSHPGVRTGDQLLFRERAADALKAAFGTWTLLFGIVIGICLWMTLVYDPGELHLNLALSFLASVQGVILQIAANRGDRISAEVAAHTRENTDTLLGLSAQILKINRQQTAILQQLESIRLRQGSEGNPAPALSDTCGAPPP
jgi:hypothetical protein